MRYGRRFAHCSVCPWMYRTTSYKARRTEKGLLGKLPLKAPRPPRMHSILIFPPPLQLTTLWTVLPTNQSCINQYNSIKQHGMNGRSIGNRYTVNLSLSENHIPKLRLIWRRITNSTRSKRWSLSWSYHTYHWLSKAKRLRIPTEEMELSSETYQERMSMGRERAGPEDSWREAESNPFIRCPDILG